MGAVVLWVVVLFAPGAVLCRLLRLPWHVCVAAGPVLTFGLVGLATPVFGAAGVPWRPWTAGLLLLGAVVVAAAVRRWVLPRFQAEEGERPPSRFGVAWALPGVVAAGAVGGFVLLRILGTDLGAINQYWDAVWHTNYTGWIARTGEASPLRAGLFLNTETHAPAFYPSAMHAVGALVVSLTGANPIVVLNAGLLVFTAVLLPVGTASLAWTVSRGNGMAAGFAALASSWFSSLPFDQLWRPAWPFLLVMALSGPVVALLVSGRVATRPGQMLAAVLAVTGVVSVHPSGVMTVGVAVLAWLLVRLVLDRQGLRRHVLVLAGIGALAALGLAVQLRQVFAVSDTLVATTYPTPYTVPQALSQLAQFKVGFATGPGQWVLTGLAVAGGVVALCRRHTAWPVAAGLCFTVLAVQTLTGRLPFLHTLTSAFWNDSWRLGGVVAWIAAVLVGLALAEVVGWSRGIRVPEKALPVVAAGVAVAAFLGTSAGYVGRNDSHLATGYRPGVVGPGHVAAMRALAGIVPPGQLVLNDPMDGSAWMYSVSGVHPMFVHYAVDRLSPDQQLVLSSLDRLDRDPAVREAVHRLGVRYVYSGNRAIYPWTWRSPGFLGLDRVSSLVPVFRTETATVYRIQPAADGLPPA